MTCEAKAGVGRPGESAAPIEAMDGRTLAHGNLADDCLWRSVIDDDDFTARRSMAS
jgi:hypothetical protein